jgi:tetratricopeptide (TPR) repeat protein
VFLLWLFFLVKAGMAQHIDSLIIQSKSTLNKKNKIDILNTIAQTFGYVDNDSAYYYAQLAYNESVIIKYEQGEALALLYQANHFINTGNNQTAMDLIKQAELISQRLGNKWLLGKTYQYYGSLFFHSMLYDKAFESYENASKLLDRKEDYYNCINKLGILYAIQNKFEDALKLFNQTLNEVKKINAIEVEAEALNNIATVYKNTGKLNEALELYKKALDINLSNQNYKFSISNLGNIAFVYIALGDTVNSIRYFDSTLYYTLKVKDIYNTLYTRINKSKIYLLQGKYNIIEDDLIDILSVAEKSNWFDLSLECVKTLTELYARKQEYAKAYEYSQLCADLYDTVQSEGNTKKLAELQFKYNFEKESLILNAKNRQKGIFIIALSVLIIFLVIIIVTVFIQQKTKVAKTNLERKNLLLEKEKLNLEQQNLSKQLELRNKEITSSILLIQKKNDIISSIANKLMEAKSEFTPANIKLIEKCIEELCKNTDDNERQNFEYYFNQVYESFYKKLFEINPNLTPNERRLCAYIKLQMNTKEIAALTNSTPRSIEVARYRLRKKLNISNQTASINIFLEKL